MLHLLKKKLKRDEETITGDAVTTRTQIRPTSGGPIIYLVSNTRDKVHLTETHSGAFRDCIFTSLLTGDARQYIPVQV